MSEIVIGDIVARLRADTTDWQRGLQAAMQSLAQFQQQVQQQSGTMQHGLQSSLLQTTQALHGVQAAQVQATQTTQQLTHNITQLGQTLQQGQQHAQSFGASWRTALSVAGGIGLATSITGIVSALKEFAVSTVEVGARLEAMRNSLSALAGSAAAGRQQFEQLFQTAQQLGVPFETLARGFRTLTAAATQAGLPLHEQQRLLSTLTIESRRVGASNEELGRVLLALGQSASKGKFAMEELRQQMGEAMPTVMAAFARGMGRTTEELEKLIEAGIRFPTGARALIRGFEEMQAAGGKTAEGLQQGFNRFGNEIVRSKDLLTQSLTPALTAVTEQARNFLKVLNDSAQAQKQLADVRAQEGRLGTGLREGDITRLPAEQQRRLTQINRLLGEQTLAQGDPNAPPMFQPSREEFIKQLQDERTAILANAQAVKSQGDEQMQTTAVINKARADQERQRDTIADLTKQMDALGKAQEDFRRKAGLTPELSGRPGGSLEEQTRFQQGLQQATRPELEKLAGSMANLPAGVVLPQETVARLRELDRGYGRIGEALDAIKDKQEAATKAAREAEQARLKDIREQEQEQKQRIQGLARDLDIFGLTLSPEEEADLKQQAKDQHQRMQEFARGLDIFGLELSPEQERQRRVGTAFDQRLQAAIEQQQAARAERPEARLRAQATREGLTLTPEQEGNLARLTALRQEQGRLTEAVRLFTEAGDAVGQAWTSALTSIADHTKTVSGAFRDMARSIAQSLAQIALQEGSRALIRFGVGLLSGAVVGGNTSSAASSGDISSLFQGASADILGTHAGGGIINRPQLAMLGEPGSTPEYIFNNQQMQQFMASVSRAAPSAGGQAAGGNSVVIMNFPSEEAANQARAQQEALGMSVVMNAVLSDLSQGSGSRIHRAISTLSR